MPRSRGGAPSSAMEAYNIKQLELLNEQQKRKIEEEREKARDREEARARRDREEANREATAEEFANRREAEVEARTQARTRRFQPMEQAAGDSVSYLTAFAKRAKRGLLGLASILRGEWTDDDEDALLHSLGTYETIFSEPNLRTTEYELDTPELQARYRAFGNVSLTILDIVDFLKDEATSWYLGPKEIENKNISEAIDDSIRRFQEATTPTAPEPAEEDDEAVPEEADEAVPEYGDPIPDPMEGPEPIFSTPVPEGAEEEEPAQFYTAQPDPAPARFYQTQPEPEPEPEPGLERRSTPKERKKNYPDIRETQRQRAAERASRIRTAWRFYEAQAEREHQERAAHRAEADQQAETMDPPNVPPAEIPIPEMVRPEEPTPAQVPSAAPAPDVPPEPEAEVDFERPEPEFDFERPEPEPGFGFGRPDPQAVHEQEPERASFKINARWRPEPKPKKSTATTSKRRERDKEDYKTMIDAARRARRTASL